MQRQVNEFTLSKTQFHLSEIEFQQSDVEFLISKIELGLSEMNSSQVEFARYILKRLRPLGQDIQGTAIWKLTGITKQTTE